MNNDDNLEIMAAKTFQENPKWAGHTQFVEDYLEGMVLYLSKHPNKSVKPYMEFFCDLMTILKHEQDKFEFENNKKTNKETT